MDSQERWPPVPESSFPLRSSVMAVRARRVIGGLRRRPRSRLAATAVAVALVTLSCWTGVSYAALTVVPLPTVQVHTQALRFHGRRSLLVTSILVGNIEGMRIDVSCGRCRRIRATIHETRPTAASKHFVGVDWIVIIGRDILLEVSHFAEIGRYLLLGASGHNTLVYKTTGCLAVASHQRINCPPAALEVPRESNVAGGNPAAKLVSETPVQEEVKKKAEEAAVKKKAEEAVAKKAEEAVDKKKTEEAAAKQAEANRKAEEAKAKQAEEEAKQAEAKRIAEEAARKKTEEEAKTWAETPGSVVHTWTDYADAGGSEGPEIPSNETIQVRCRIQGFAVADGDTWWYLIASSPWNDNYYGSADAFYNNGRTSGSLTGTPFVDPNVREC
jgi:hypothetical protein